MKKQSIKKFTLFRLIHVFIAFMLILLSIVAFSYRSYFQLAAENNAISMAEIIKSGLTAHMKAGIMDKRDYFLNEIASTNHGIQSIEIIRADSVSRDFGIPSRFVKRPDLNLKNILNSKETYIKWKEWDNKLEVIVPYMASSEGNLNCLLCHQANEGEVLGGVNITMNTEEYQNFAFKYSYIIAAIMIFFALMVIWNMFHVTEHHILKPIKKIITEGHDAYLLHNDISTDKYESIEFEEVAQNINDFNHDVLDKEDELRKKNIELENLNEEIESTLKETMFVMGEIEEIRSHETKGHTKRVSMLSALIAKEYGLDDEQVKLIESASSLHDIGKIGIADAILNKADKLTEEEFTVMKTHTTLGYKILKHSKRQLLQAAASIAYGHHEKYDGTGYPQGLKGEEIALFPRIVAIVDVLDALLTKRVYKDVWSIEKVIVLLKEEKGKHFEPKLVDIVLKNIDVYAKIIHDMSEDA